MKYINKLALMALAVLGFGLQAAEPAEVDTAAMADAEGWSLPAKIGMGLGGTAALGAGALGVDAYLKSRASQQAASAAQQLMENAQQAVSDAQTAFNGVRTRGLAGHDEALANLLQARSNLGTAETDAAAILNNANVPSYASNIKNAVSNWWQGPQPIAAPAIVPTEPEYTFLAERAIGDYLKNRAHPRIKEFAGYFKGSGQSGPRDLYTTEFAEPFNPYMAPAPVVEMPAAPWYSPIMNVPGAISNRWGALDPYSKVGAALAGAALLGGGLYGANRLYQRYRGGDMPAVEATLTGTITDEQVAKNLQKQEVIGVLATMLGLVNNEGSGAKMHGNVERLNRLQSYVESLNAVGVATTELASIIKNIKDEFAAIRRTDYSAAAEKHRSKIASMYASLENLLSDMLRNARQ